MNIQNLIRSLENGICPQELSYNGDYNNESIDWERVLYNVKYHQPQFYEDKFPSEIHQIPAFDQVINLIVEKNKDNSPLIEIEEKQKILNKQYNGEKISITPSDSSSSDINQQN
jgi:hypothetical protein